MPRASRSQARAARAFVNERQALNQRSRKTGTLLREHHRLDREIKALLFPKFPKTFGRITLREDNPGGLNATVFAEHLEKSCRPVANLHCFLVGLGHVLVKRLLKIAHEACFQVC